MRERKMAEVLFGAREVFFRCGYEGATVDAIAAEGKVSKATMYSHFPTKEQGTVALVFPSPDGCGCCAILKRP